MAEDDPCLGSGDGTSEAGPAATQLGFLRSHFPSLGLHFLILKMVPSGAVLFLSHVRVSAILRTEAQKVLCPWDFPGKNTEVGCHALLQELFPTQGSNPGFHLASGFFTI